MLKQYKLRFYNFRLVIFLLAISVIGIVLVGSAREDLKSKQLVGVILGLIIMVILSLMDYSWISNFQWIMYGANIVLLLIVRLFGDSANGAARWIDFGFIRFQPTELSKIIIILFFARFFMDHEEDLNTFKTLAKSVILLAIPLFLIYEQPDMKNTLMLLAVFCILIYIAGLSYKIIGGMFLIIIPLAIIFVSIVVQPDQKLIKDYQRKRIMAFLYPENEEYSDDIEQQNNSKTAIASGELIGKKLSGDKEVASVNDGNFVSENQTDFIFSVIGEEFGFVGCVVLIIVFACLVYQCMNVAKKSGNLIGTYVAVGVACYMGFQSFINIAVATGTMPNTGQPLPFISYGLSSLMSASIAIGMVLNIYLTKKKTLGGSIYECRISCP